MSFLDRMNGRVFAGRKGPHGNRKVSSRKVASRKPSSPADHVAHGVAGDDVRQPDQQRPDP